jgi:hypothetical protein
MRWLFLTTAAAALMIAGGHMAAPVEHAWEHEQAAGDLVTETDLRLQEALTSQRLDAELDAALKAEDEDLAQSLIELAADHGLPVDERHRQALADLKAHETSRGLRDFVDGFLSGGHDSGASLTGAVTADVTGYGDLRDLVVEGRKVVRGEPADQLTVGLAAAGLALSVATWTSLGAALPARSGLSLVKASQRAGRLSKPLATALAGTAAKALDREALQTTLTSASRLELAGARQSAARILRPAAMTEFRQIGDATATLYTRTGQRGARQALALAQSPQELRNAARLATIKGTKARGIFAVLGRGALTVAGLSMAALGWLATFLGWLFGAALFARRFGLTLGRLIFRRKPQLQAMAWAGLGSQMPTSTTARVASTCSPDSAKLARIPARL